MAHQADETFFETKRDWSRRKDRILSHYLFPYLTKVAKIGKPILIVDGFAGPGKFADGSDGSPIIICQRAKEQIERGIRLKVLCIERLRPLCARLNENLSSYEFAEAVHGSFGDFVARLRDSARTQTLFLYIDPYAIRGLEWSAIESVGETIRTHGSSVELLLNLNVPAFARSARAALARKVPTIDPAVEDDELMDVGFPETPSKDNLSVIAGGDWWCDVVMKDLDFRVEVAELMNGFAVKLRNTFHEVCFIPIKAKDSHTIPKYYLVYGTRRIDGLALMNDEMVNAVREGGTQGDLFIDVELDDTIISCCETKVRREDLIHNVLRQMFGRVKGSEIRRRIDRLQSLGELVCVGSVGSGKDNDLLVAAQTRLF